MDQKNKQAKTKSYRNYSPTQLTNAILKVKEEITGIRKTAREYNVPEATLRHRLSGRHALEAVRSGPPPLFSQEEEAVLVEHLKFTASVGYGYSRAEVIDIASEYAIYLQIRDREHPLSMKWYQNFMSRWPELKVIKPRGLEMQRAKATSVESVNKYYTELNKILVKYDLLDKPERIYNVDEKGLSTSHNAPNVVALVDSKPVAVKSGTRQNITVLGCGSALGNQVPPYFVFPGKRMRQDLLEGKTAGADGDVTESGWSNSTIFRNYLEHHLMKYLPDRTDTPVLLMYDGHKSHISLGLVQWAKSVNLILFVLPAHTSHVLQPMDVGCFGPFERIFNGMSHKYMREHPGQSITRYSICELGCKAYVKALSQDNLQSAFRKSGIFPFNPEAVDKNNFLPATVLATDPEVSEETETTAPETETVAAPQPQENPHEVEVEPEENRGQDNVASFFVEKENNLKRKKTRNTQRKYLSSVVSGRAITEEDIVSEIQNHQTQKKKAKRPPTGQRKQTKRAKADKSVTNITAVVTEDDDTHMSEDNAEEDNVPCCVCGRPGLPKELEDEDEGIVVMWAKCDWEGCEHWTHLRYCCDVTCIRRHHNFFCPCHGVPCRQDK